MSNNITRPLLHEVMTKAANHLVPFQVSIELTYRCNHFCQHCYIDRTLTDELSFPEIKDILDQLRDAGTLYLLFTGGEPFIRKDINEILSYAKAKGFLIMLVTNGTLITPENILALKEVKPVSVGVSLHGATAHTHDGITGISGSFETTIHTVESLKKCGLHVSLKTTLMNANINEINGILELAGKLGVFVRLSYEIVPGRRDGSVPYQNLPGYSELVNYYNIDWVNEKCKIDDTGSVCKAGKGICSITPGGDIFPCLLMPMKVGNLKKADFIDIWMQNPCRELDYLRSISWENFSDCPDCEYLQYCTKCMGTAYMETGYLTRPAPSACHNARIKSELFKQKGVNK